MKIKQKLLCEHCGATRIYNLDYMETCYDDISCKKCGKQTNLVPACKKERKIYFSI